MPQDAYDSSRPQVGLARRRYPLTPEDIDLVNQVTAAQRLARGWNSSRPPNPDPDFSRSSPQTIGDVDPRFRRVLSPFLSDIDLGFAPPAVRPAGPLARTPAALGRQISTTPVRTGPIRPDPTRTDVFQPGPDGKLHPISGWHTTGPFDFDVWSHNINWGGVGRDLEKITSRSLDSMAAASLLEQMGLKSALAGSRKFIDRHHPEPRFMGGRNEQELVDLVRSFHSKFHQTLNPALREAGLPPVGGTTGKSDVWRGLFKGYPRARDAAVEILRRKTREFDVEHGTSIYPYLEKELKITNPKLSPPK